MTLQRIFSHDKYILWFMLMLSFLLLQTSCSKSGGDGASGDVITSTPTSTSTPILAAPVVVRVTPAGNTVSIATSESTSVSFIFPAGAVSEPLDVTLTPL